MSDYTQLEAHVAKFRKASPNIAAAFDEVQKHLQRLDAQEPPPQPEPEPPPAEPIVKMMSGSLRWMGDYGAAALEEHKALGVRWWRENITEISGTWVRGSQAIADGMANVVRAKGVKLLPLLLGYQHASSVSAAVIRYGPGGPLYCADWFELGNEPYWEGVSPEQYAKDVALGLRAARAANPQARLMVAGFVPLNWTARMWAAEPDSWRLADAIAVHPYCNRTAGAVNPTVYSPTDPNRWPYQYQRYRNIHAEVLRVTGRDLPVYITEVGWHTDGSYAGETVPASSESEQAQYLAAAWELAKAAGVAGFNVYCLADNPNQAPSGEAFYGLVRGDRSRKPAYPVVGSLT